MAALLLLHLQQIPVGGVTLTNWNRLTERVESMCNPNLLINTDFRNPVNQRGQSEYSVNTGDIRTIDCWTLQGNFSSATLVVDTGMVIFKSTGGNQGIKQNIEKEKMQVGEYYTISLFVDGVILSDSFKFDGTDIIKEYPANNMISYATINSENVITIYPLVKCGTESKNFLIRASKLELGTFSTLANEVVDYAAELRKCQRYLQVIPAYNTFRAVYVDNSGLKFNIPIEGMRINPSLSGSIAICGIDNAVQVDFIMSAYTTDNMIVIAANKNSHGLKDAIFATGDKSVILSAEL